MHVIEGEPFLIRYTPVFSSEELMSSYRGPCGTSRFMRTILSMARHCYIAERSNSGCIAYLEKSSSYQMCRVAPMALRQTHSRLALSVQVTQSESGRESKIVHISNTSSRIQNVSSMLVELHQYFKDLMVPTSLVIYFSGLLVS